MDKEKEEHTHVEWVGVAVLRDEFKVKDASIDRWRRRGLIKFKEVDQWRNGTNTRWLYDKTYFASVHKELKNNDFLAQINAAKKYGRKLAAIERDIELKKI